MLTLNILTNKIIREIKNDFLVFLLDNYNIKTEMPFASKINQIFEKGEIKSLKQTLLEKYNFRKPFASDIKLSSLYAGFYQQDIEDYFDKHEVNEDFLYNPELFKIYYKNPEKQIFHHVKTAIKKGYVNYAGEDENYSYCAIVYEQVCTLALNTTVIIKGEKYHGKYEVVSVFPSCHAGPYFYLNDGFNFFNPYYLIDTQKIKENRYDEKYCVYGFVLDAKIVEENETCIITFEKSSRTQFYEMTVPFLNPEQFQYMGKTFYKFDFNAEESFGLFGRGKVPIFMRADLIPKGTKIFVEDFLTVKVAFFAHLANKDVDLDYFKFGFGLALFQTKIPSREAEARHVQNVETHVTNQYCTGLIMDYKKFDDYIVELCILFHRRYGVYPNYIKTNNMTVEKIFEALDSCSDESEELDLSGSKMQEECAFPVNVTIGGDEQNRLCFETDDYKLYFVDDTYMADGYFVLMLGDSPDGGEPVFESENTETLALRKAA